MKHLKTYNEKAMDVRLFDPDNSIKLDLEDICQELKDEKFSIDIVYMNDATGIHCHAFYSITIEKDPYSWFKVTDCREVILRMIDYMKMNGFNNYRIKSFNPSDPSHYGHYPKSKIHGEAKIDITTTLPLGKFKRAISSKWSNTTSKITITFDK